VNAVSASVARRVELVSTTATVAEGAATTAAPAAPVSACGCAGAGAGAPEARARVIATTRDATFIVIIPGAKRARLE
jgi:hypothetical protein